MQKARESLFEEVFNRLLKILLAERLWSRYWAAFLNQSFHEVHWYEAQGQKNRDILHFVTGKRLPAMDMPSVRVEARAEQRKMPAPHGCRRRETLPGCRVGRRWSQLFLTHTGLVR
jgi:hypothetical protein